MVTLTGIRRVVDKLNAPSQDLVARNAHIVESMGRGGENRFSFYIGTQLVFTFGITRSPRRKSKLFHYVPRQMHLKHEEYRKLHDCPMSKVDYVKLLIQKKIVAKPYK